MRRWFKPLTALLVVGLGALAFAMACLGCDLPGHGDHPAPAGTFGKTEVSLVRDLLAAVRAARPLPQATALFGNSQGGAIALQAASEDQSAYFAVASVASFAALDSIVDNGARDYHPVTRTFSGPCTALVRLGTRFRAGFDPAEIRPAEAAATINIPVFVGHGSRDAFIPSTQAQLIFNAVPHQDKTLKFVPDGEHGNVLARGGNPFYADIAEFFLKNLPPPGTAGVSPAPQSRRD